MSKLSSDGDWENHQPSEDAYISFNPQALSGLKNHQHISTVILPLILIFPSVPA